MLARRQRDLASGISRGCADSAGSVKRMGRASSSIDELGNETFRKVRPELKAFLSDVDAD
jgi:hypothetical protein